MMIVAVGDKGGAAMTNCPYRSKTNKCAGSNYNYDLPCSCLSMPYTECYQYISILNALSGGKMDDRVKRIGDAYREGRAIGLD